jgi:hypothetical protein
VRATNSGSGFLAAFLALSHKPMTSTSNPIPPSSTFVDILKKAIETYEGRTGKTLPTDLSSMRDYHTTDEFRGLIQEFQAQAQNVGEPFPKGEF